MWDQCSGSKLRALLPALVRCLSWLLRLLLLLLIFFFLLFLFDLRFGLFFVFLVLSLDLLLFSGFLFLRCLLLDFLRPPLRRLVFLFISFLPPDSDGIDASASVL